MGLRKRASRILDLAKKRLAGIKAIDPALDLGGGLTVDNYQSAISDFVLLVDAHNQLIANFDKSKNGVDEVEILLRNLNRRFLAAVGSEFGFNSDEYEMAGGTRRSEIKKSNTNLEEDEQPSEPEV